MSIRAHRNFDLDGQSELRIWRYMDAMSFLALVVQKQFHFPLVEALDDPWEGAPTLQDVFEHARQKAESMEERVRKVRAIQSEYSNRRGEYCASCWHIAPSESFAMWQLYAAQGKGVAIACRLGKLLSALKSEREI